MRAQKTSLIRQAKFRVALSRPACARESDEIATIEERRVVAIGECQKRSANHSFPFFRRKAYKIVHSQGNFTQNVKFFFG